MSAQLSERQKLAVEVLRLAKDRLLVSSPFLAPAASLLPFVPSPDTLSPLSGTDAKAFYFNADHVLACFAATHEAPVHDYVHTLLHCLFLHPFANPGQNRARWDLACDIAAECIAAELCGPRPGDANGGTEYARGRICNALQQTPLTAESVFELLKTDRFVDEEQAWQQLFCVDDHRFWYGRPDVRSTASAGADAGHAGEGHTDETPNSDSESEAETQPGGESPNGAHDEGAAHFKSPNIPSILEDEFRRNKSMLLPNTFNSSRAQPEVSVSPKPLELHHMPLNCFLQNLGLEEADILDEAALSKTADALMDPANKDIALHSSNKRTLKAIAHSAGTRYEDILSKQSTPEFFFPQPVTDLNLPKRTSNILARENIKTVGDLCSFGEPGLQEVRGAGTAVINSIKAALKGINALLVDLFETATNKTTETAKSDSMLKGAPDFSDIASNPSNLPLNTSISSACSQSEQEAARAQLSDVRIALIDISEFALVSPTNLATLVVSFSSSEIKTLVEDSALCEILGRNPWGLTQEEMLASASLLDASITIDELMIIVNRICDAQRARFDNEFYYLIEPSIEEVVSERVKNVSWQLIVCGRLAGKTLESIGKDNGITRERVRQIANKAIDANLLSGTRAGRYLDLMRHYQLSERETRFGLGATIEEWKAASLVKKTAYEDDPAPAPAEVLMEDSRIPPRVRLALEEEIYHDFVKIGDDYVPRKCLELMLLVLKQYGSKSSLEVDEFTNLYRQMLKEHELQDDPELQPSERCISKLRLQKCVLSGYRARVRYYDFDKHDVRNLINSLGFEDYCAGEEVSTRSFLTSKPEILRDFEIEDAYELYSLLRSYAREAKKTGEMLPYSMTRRTPIILIGKPTGRRKWQSLPKNTPISRSTTLWRPTRKSAASSKSL